MKPVKDIIGKLVRRRRGNALILAILTTMLLFIIGMAFLSTTMTERATTVSVDQNAYLDNGVRVVIDRINEVLVNDLFDNGLLGRNAAYDYPDARDPWLASLEPEFDPGGLIPTVFGNYPPSGTGKQNRPPHYYWRHITDLWNTFTDGKPAIPHQDSPYYYYDPDTYDDTATNPYYPDYLHQVVGTDSTVDAAMYLVSDSFVPIRVVLEDEVIQYPVQNRPEAGWWSSLTGYPFSKIRINGMRADADGDGLADARWVRLDRIGPEGQFLWAAVRIIDNGGMININTAFRNPEDTIEGANPATYPQWDGTQLSHVNLINFRAATEGANVLYFQANRIGSVASIPLATDYLHDIMYERDVGIRVLNPFYVSPTQIYQPFDIFDELELRNRYLMNSNVKPRCGIVWQKTFDPGSGGVGVHNPYIDSYLLSYALYGGVKNSIDQWFAKVKPDWDVPPLFTPAIVDYNRRHLATTYNFDRITRRGDGTGSKAEMKDYPGSRKVPIRLPNNGTGPGNGPDSGFGKPKDKEDYIKYLACAIYRGLPDDKAIQNRFGGEYNREWLAWNWALNIIDAQDSYDDPATPAANDDTPSKMKAGDNTYFGVETLDLLKKHTLCISKIGYVEVDDDWANIHPDPVSEPKPVNGKYYAIELFNPDDTPGSSKSLGDFEIRIHHSSSMKKLSALSGVISNSDKSGTGSGDTEVCIFINDDTKDNLGGSDAVTEAEKAFVSEINSGKTLIDITDTGDLFDLDKGDKILVINKTIGDTTIGYMPVDCVEVTSDMLSGKNTAVVKSRNITFPGTNFLLPTADKETVFDPWENATKDLGDDINPRPKPTGDLEPITTDPPTTQRDTNFAGIDRVKIADYSSDPNMITVAEVLDTFAIGYRYNEKDNKYQTLWQGLVDSVVAIKKLTSSSTGPYTQDQELGKELGSYGRVRLDDPVFMKYHDDKNPNNRRIDANLFGLLTWFDPSNDGVDNDGNPYTQDKPSKTEAKYYEQSIAGRININTAPWFVIAQLPWMQNPDPAVTPEDKLKLARAIVAYRDKTAIPGTPIDYARIVDAQNGEFRSRKIGMGLNLTNDPDIREEPGFADIYELINVTHDLANAGAGAYDPAYDIRRFGRDTVNNDDGADADGDKIPNYKEGPFYESAADNEIDDMRERDVLFKRISNLATVRSDVFTAYILVRLGRAGPQKRMIAIFDRSNVYSSSDKPKLVALHPVPDPR